MSNLKDYISDCSIQKPLLSFRSENPKCITKSNSAFRIDPSKMHIWTQCYNLDRSIRKSQICTRLTNPEYNLKSDTILRITNFGVVFRIVCDKGSAWTFLCKEVQWSSLKEGAPNCEKMRGRCVICCSRK